MTSPEPHPGSSEPLDRAQEAIDDAKAAESNAPGDLAPGPDLDEPYTGDGVDPEDGVTPRF